MFHLRKLGAGAVLAAAALAATAGAASASQRNDFFDRGGGNTVFVQSNYTAGNTVSVYDRTANGTLTLAGTYPTGGLGGALGGAAVDYLASRGFARLRRRSTTCCSPSTPAATRSRYSRCAATSCSCAG